MVVGRRARANGGARRWSSGLEFTLGRLVRSRHHAVVGGTIDLLVNASLGLAIGVAAFGLSFASFLAYERPKIVEDLEMALGELQIEWIPVPEDSPWIGHTLAEAGFRARTGVTVIAILREPEPISGAQPSDTIERRDTLVTVGKAGQYPRFRRLLSRGDPPD